MDQLTGKHQLIQILLVARLFSFFVVRLIALLADLVFFCGFFAACVWAVLAFGDRLVTTVVRVLLAFFAKLLFLVRFNATFMITFLAFGFCLYATALSGKGDTATEAERY